MKGQLKGRVSFVVGMAIIAAFLVLGAWIAEHPWAGIVLLSATAVSFIGILTVLFITLPRTPMK